MFAVCRDSGGVSQSTHGNNKETASTILQPSGEATLWSSLFFRYVYLLLLFLCRLLRLIIVGRALTLQISSRYYYNLIIKFEIIFSLHFKFKLYVSQSIEAKSHLNCQVTTESVVVVVISYLSLK